MNKLTCVISCPIDCYSGYSSRSRDFVRAVIETRPEWDVKIIPQRWGETRWGYLKDHNDTLFTPKLIHQLTSQPDIFIQISIPSEFKKVGKYNIGVTAGIETSLYDPSWVRGANNMDLILVSSNHSAKVFEESKFDITDNTTGQVTQRVELTTKVRVLFEGGDVTKYFPTEIEEKTAISKVLDSVPESFLFLTTGHWMQGDFGEDRKNMGFTIKSFLETFKNTKNPPALVMKSHTMTTSTMDRERMLDKIDGVRRTVKGTLPSIYLIHGEISDSQMNELYNHSKIKAFVSLPKGEGFGRPFLEFSLTNKPIIASSWSGQTDFLDKEFVRYVKGELKNVHPSAAVQNIILPQAQWFTPDSSDVGRAYKDVYRNYRDWKAKAKRQGYKSRTEFSYESMVETLDNLLTQYIPEFPKAVNLKLPQLAKIELPKLKKI